MCSAAELFTEASNKYNPYRILYEELNSINKDRVFGSAGFTITLAKGLTLDLKSGMDMGMGTGRGMDIILTIQRLKARKLHFSNACSEGLNAIIRNNNHTLYHTSEGSLKPPLHLCYLNAFSRSPSPLSFNLSK